MSDNLYIEAFVFGLTREKTMKNGNRYNIKEKIGRGAMGDVFLAEDIVLKRQVALKMLRLSESIVEEARKEAVSRFLREAQAAARLTHNNIVIIYDVGEIDSKNYISMEYIRGETLNSLLSKGHLSVNMAVNIMVQVLDALDYAHANGVVHRDIKPDNIFFLSKGVVKVTDFGIARLTDDISMTMPGTIIGTPGYMSPEQVKGEDVDSRSDIFSAGLVLYELLTGVRAFSGESITSVMYKIVNEDPKPLLQLNPDAPIWLEAVIRKATAKEPSQRYQKAEDMITDLKNSSFSDYKAEQGGAVCSPTGFEKSATSTKGEMPEVAKHSTAQSYEGNIRNVAESERAFDNRQGDLNAASGHYPTPGAYRGTAPPSSRSTYGQTGFGRDTAHPAYPMTSAPFRSGVSYPASQKTLGKSNRNKIIALTISAAAALLLLAGILVFYFAGEGVKREHYERGMSAYRKDDFSTAIIEFEAAKDYDNAKIMLRRAKAGPNNLVLYNEAMLAIDEDDYERAFGNFSDILETDYGFKDVADMVKIMKALPASPLIINLESISATGNHSAEVKSYSGEELCVIYADAIWTYENHDRKDLISSIDLLLFDNSFNSSVVTMSATDDSQFYKEDQDLFIVPEAGAIYDLQVGNWFYQIYIDEVQVIWEPVLSAEFFGSDPIFSALKFELWIDLSEELFLEL